MRDDVSRLLSGLISTTRKKYSLFEEIYRLDSDCFHYLNTGDLDKTEDLLKSIENLRTEIDTLDFESARTKEKILKTAGIDESEFNRLLEKGDHEKLGELKALKRDMRNILNKLVRNREKLISKMGEISLKLEVDIKELELMRKIELDKKGI